MAAGLANSVRNPSLISGLSVPLILGLSAWGFDRLTKSNWIAALFGRPESFAFPRLMLGISQMMTGLLLIVSLRAVFDYSQEWLFLNEKDITLEGVIALARTEEPQWVALPLGAHFWAPPATDAGLKLTRHARPSFWKDREPPVPYLEVLHENLAVQEGDVVNNFLDFNLIRHEAGQYAYVIDEAGERVVCTAVSRGGHIDGSCQLSRPGRLIVEENVWRGWVGWVDGERTPLADNPQWLEMPMPAGTHQFTFRYWSWDVPVGVLVLVIGAAALVDISRRGD